MKFRTKIWMLPLSAALVFVLGVLASYAVGAQTAGMTLEEFMAKRKGR